jgi:preprotein translocase subunit YajC
MGVITWFLLTGTAAAADAAPQQQGGIAGLMLPIVLFVLIFYFLIFRPQKKKQQQHDQMVSSISRGDTIVSAGGFFGSVCDVLDDSYIVEIAEGVRVRILKTSISVKREAGDGSKPPQKPRRKKKRRLVAAGEGQGEAVSAQEPTDSAAAEIAEEPTEPTEARAAADEGVTADESDALIGDSLGAAEPAVDEASSAEAVSPADTSSDEEKRP